MDSHGDEAQGCWLYGLRQFILCSRSCLDLTCVTVAARIAPGGGDEGCDEDFGGFVRPNKLPSLLNILSVMEEVNQMYQRFVEVEVMRLLCSVIPCSFTNHQNNTRILQVLNIICRVVYSIIMFTLL